MSVMQTRMYVAHRRPDGTFEYCGEVYRLEDGGRDRFVVRKLRNAEVVGGLHFVSGRSDMQTELDGPATEVDVVRAIARSLELPGDIVPLQ
jgi:hypothetical protein